MKLKRSILILLSVFLLFSLLSCADGETEDNLSVPLVELTVDTSRYMEEGVVDYVIINNSGIDITYEGIMHFVFENGEWTKVEMEGPIEESARWYELAAGESKESMMSFSNDTAAGQHMLMMYCGVAISGISDSENGAYNGFWASAVFELPER